MATTRVFPVLSAASAAATQTSTAYKALGVRALSVQATVASATSPVGTLSIQGSNDGTNFADITSVAVSANSTKVLSISDVSFVNIRVVYTYTSGTGGTIDATLAIVEAY